MITETLLTEDELEAICVAQELLQQDDIYLRLKKAKKELLAETPVNYERLMNIVYQLAFWDGRAFGDLYRQIQDRKEAQQRRKAN